MNGKKTTNKHHTWLWFVVDAVELINDATHAADEESSASGIHDQTGKTWKTTTSWWLQNIKCWETTETIIKRAYLSLISQVIVGKFD